MSHDFAVAAELLVYFC